MAGGSDVRVWAVGGIPVVKIKGQVMEGSGRELADRIMSTVAISTSNTQEFTHPLAAKPGDDEYRL